MGMSEFYGGTRDKPAHIRTLQAAIDLGINHFDTADVYGIGHNEQLVSKAFSDRWDRTVSLTAPGGLEPHDYGTPARPLTDGRFGVQLEPDGVMIRPWSLLVLCAACACSNAGAPGEGGETAPNDGGGAPGGQAGTLSPGGGGNTGGVTGTSAGGQAGEPSAGRAGASGSGGTMGGSGSEGGGRTGGMSGGGAPSGGASGSSGAGSATSGTGGAGVGGSGGTAGGIAACGENLSATCTGTNPVECHFGGDPGDYEVIVELGGDSSGDTLIDAEAHRRVLGSVATTAGQVERFSLFVNVRQPEGEPVQGVSAGTPGLDLYIGGDTPRLSSICYRSGTPLPKVWIAGDSTVCDQSSTDYAGWGQHLPQFFGAPVSIANYADSGESSGSFLGSNRLWGAIRAGWHGGDWVLIQLGHNDKEVTAAAFESNILAMVTEAKAAGINPVLLTPISRVGYELADQHVNSTGANLPQIVRDIGAAENVPVIDLTVITWEWFQTIDWTLYFALGTDRTHTNPAGAAVIAGFVRDAIRSQEIALARYLR
jgi:lysophospholipase L1-like esterase